MRSRTPKAIATTLDHSLGQLTENYAKVVPVRLVNQQATKTNILAALDLLSGKQTRVPANAPPEFHKLKAAEPEDVVIVFFAGHGTADGDRYYLIPNDLGYAGDPKNISATGRRTIIAHSLSDEDLEKGFEKIDAGRILLIIDACQSGQVLEAKEKRRGPMNSRGLAQLAYEKGMYILAAAQSYQAALEFEKLGHGLLTYTLIEKGLKQMAADINPKDQRLTAREWLDYAIERVPQETSKASARFVKRTTREIDFGEDTATGQAPRAYYRRETTGGPWVVATP